MKNVAITSTGAMLVNDAIETNFLLYATQLTGPNMAERLLWCGNLRHAYPRQRIGPDGETEDIELPEQTTVEDIKRSGAIRGESLTADQIATNAGLLLEAKSSGDFVCGGCLKLLAEIANQGGVAHFTTYIPRGTVHCSRCDSTFRYAAWKPWQQLTLEEQSRVCGELVELAEDLPLEARQQLDASGESLSTGGDQNIAPGVSLPGGKGGKAASSSGSGTTSRVSEVMSSGAGPHPQCEDALDI